MLQTSLTATIMKQTYLLTTLFCAGLALGNATSYAQTTYSGNAPNTNDIEFYETNSHVQSIASGFNMPIFLYIYDSYSRSCADLERIVFTDPEVADLYNNKLACYKLSINSAEGMKYYNYAKTRPALLYFNSNDEIIRAETGFKDKDAFMQLAFDALANNNTSKTKMDMSYANFLSSKNIYDNRVRDKEFLGNYIYDLKKFNEPYQQVVNEYIQLRDFELTSPDCAKLILDFSDDIYSKQFELLLSNKTLFTQIFNRQTVDQKIVEALRTSILNAANERDRSKMDDALALVPRTQLSNSTLLSYTLQSLYYETINDWNGFANTVNEYILKTAQPDDAFLEKSARLYAFMVSDENKLHTAEAWINKALSIKASRHQTLETQGIVLYQLGKRSKALKILEEATAAAQKQRSDYSITFRLLEDMRANRPLSSKYKK